MINNGYIEPKRNNLQIICLTVETRKYFNETQPFFDVSKHLIDQPPEDWPVTIDPLPDMDPRVEGMAYPESNSIEIRSRDFQIITDNRNWEIYKKRLVFTITHELGHILCTHKNGLQRANYNTPKDETTEGQANMFAGALLVPISHYNQFKNMNISDIAEECHCSKACASIQMLQYSLIQDKYPICFSWLVDYANSKNRITTGIPKFNNVLQPMREEYKKHLLKIKRS